MQISSFSWILIAGLLLNAPMAQAAEPTPANTEPAAAVPADSVRRIETLFSNGDWDPALALMKQLPEGETRNELCLFALDNTPVSAEVSNNQLLELLRLHKGCMPMDFEDVFAFMLAQNMERARTHVSPELQEAFEAGVGAYGGKAPMDRLAAYRLLGKSKALIELQYPFLPDTETAFSTNYKPDLERLLAYHNDRFRLSGRASDAKVLVDLYARYLKKNPLPPQATANIINAFSTLSDEEAEAWLNTIAANTDPEAVKGKYDGASTLARLTAESIREVQSTLRPSDNAKKSGSTRTSANEAANLQKNQWLMRFRWLNRLCNHMIKSPGKKDDKILRQVALIWRDRGRFIIRKNDESIQSMTQRRYYSRSETDTSQLLTPAEANAYLALAPDAEWLKCMVPGPSNSLGAADEGVAINEVKIGFLLAAERFEEAADYIGQIKQMTNARAQLIPQAEALLERMVRVLNPNQRNDNENSWRYSTYSTNSNAISLTRIRQNRNLQTFRTILEKFDKMGIRPSIDKVLAAFDAVHSSAEIYAYDDLVAIFGEPSTLSENTVYQLGTTMLGKLQKEWGDLSVQAKAQTRRSEAETKQLAIEGFLVLDRFLTEAEKGDAGKGALIHALHGTAYYLYATVLQLNKADERVIAKAQSDGLRAIETAAKRYVDAVPTLYETEYRVDVYKFWFDAFQQAGIGKTDVRDRPNLGAIRASIMTMAPDAAQKHLDLLAQMFAAEFQKVKPNEKHVYLNNVMKIIDGTETAKRFKERLDYYKELLDEVKLEVEPAAHDGKVSSDLFAFRVNLLYTPELGRESGGFSRYLDNGNDYYSMDGDQMANLRKDAIQAGFEDALSEHYDIASVLFSDPNVKTEKTDNQWEKMPLAWVIVKPKDLATDRIPSLSMSLLFSDNGQNVVLPIESAPVPVKFDLPKNQPVPKNLDLKQRLNLSKLASEGTVRLDVESTADDIIGSWESLFKTEQWDGFTVRSKEDMGLQANKIAGGKIQFERKWVYSLAVKNKDLMPDAFHFAVPVKADTSVTLYTYDVNFETCNGICPLKTGGPSARLWILLGVLCTGIAAAGTVFGIRARRRAHGQVQKGIHPIEKLTVFSLIRYLKTCAALPSVSSAEKAEIEARIHMLEMRHFTADANEMSDDELQAVYRSYSHLSKGV